jgi:enediyne polyketide synthase
VAADTGVTCDVEPVRVRGASRWQDLLGSDRWSLAQEIARQAGESLDQAATRVWVGLECLKKADAVWNAPLLVLAARADGWVCLRTSSGIVATYVATLQEHDGPLALGVLVSQVTCAATNTATA